MTSQRASSPASSAESAAAAGDAALPRVSREQRPSEQTASTLLRIGVAGPARPVDDLIARIEADDGHAWLLAALADAARLDGLTPATGDIEHLLCLGHAGVAQLEQLKDRGKRLLKSASTGDQRLGGLAMYFFSIAAALAHHHALIGARQTSGERRPREELHDALLDLASVTPEPWSTLLADAAMRCNPA
jgi:hypothetical protein